MTTNACFLFSIVAFGKFCSVALKNKTLTKKLPEVICKKCKLKNYNTYHKIIYGAKVRFSSLYIKKKNSHKTQTLRGGSAVTRGSPLVVFCEKVPFIWSERV